MEKKPKMERITVTMTQDQLQLIRSTGMGATASEAIRTMCMAWMAEKSIISTKAKSNLSQWEIQGNHAVMKIPEHIAAQLKERFGWDDLTKIKPTLFYDTEKKDWTGAVLEHDGKKVKIKLESFEKDNGEMKK